MHDHGVYKRGEDGGGLKAARTCAQAKLSDRTIEGVQTHKTRSTFSSTGKSLSTANKQYHKRQY